MLQFATYHVMERLPFPNGESVESICSQPFGREENAELYAIEMELWAERNNLPFVYSVKRFE